MPVPFFFALYEIEGKAAGLALWRLFGTINQLLAGLALLVVTLYLVQRGKNPWFTGVPMVLMLGSTLFAMVPNLRSFRTQWTGGGAILFFVGSILLVLALWLIVEAAFALGKARREPTTDSLQVFAEDSS